MPVHRVATLDIESAVAEIESKERIINVAAVGVGSVLIFTEPKANRRPGESETRGRK